MNQFIPFAAKNPRNFVNVSQSYEFEHKMMQNGQFNRPENTEHSLARNNQLIQSTQDLDFSVAKRRTRAPLNSK